MNANVSSLPSELLFLILSAALVDPSMVTLYTLGAIRLVCSDWKYLIDERFLELPLKVTGTNISYLTVNTKLVYRDTPRYQTKFFDCLRIMNQEFWIHRANLILSEIHALGMVLPNLYKLVDNQLDMVPMNLRHYITTVECNGALVNLECLSSFPNLTHFIIYSTYLHDIFHCKKELKSLGYNVEISYNPTFEFISYPRTMRISSNPLTLRRNLTTMKISSNPLTLRRNLKPDPMIVKFPTQDLERIRLKTRQYLQSMVTQPVNNNVHTSKIHRQTKWQTNHKQLKTHNFR
jgi:hypothetical protein